MLFRSIHGDAAFPGQGVVAETLNLQLLPGYSVGGSLHLIADNQVGFTTDPGDGRSTRHCSDIAKGYDVPVIHVNADDVDACRAAVRLAMAYRQRFGKDVLIDLIGYRRWGHNEGDEPSYTQPMMYRAIEEHPRVAEVYARKLIAEGVITPEEVEEMRERVATKLRQAHDELEVRVRERTAQLASANASLQQQIAERERVDQARLELLARLVFAQEDERRRIAREMHDQFGEQLTALGVQIQIGRAHV